MPAFADAIRHLLSKNLLPTSMSSAEIQALDAAVRRQSFFSARTTLTSYLDETRTVIESIVNPRQEPPSPNSDLPSATTGYNPATARQQLRKTLAKLGYDPGAERGSIKDLSSDARLDLVVRTNTELAQGAGAFVKQNANPDVVDLFPALELVRFDQAREPRNWHTRWRIAAQVAGDAKAAGSLGNHGRMVALKSSGIWQKLGDGAGGYTDTLGNPYPPFAFNSGMWTQPVSRDDAISMDLIAEGEPASPAQFDFNTLFKAAA